MRVGVGYSENPDTLEAGRQAAQEALNDLGLRAGITDGRSLRDECDLVLLFSTARHDAYALQRAVAEVVGEGTPIVGGGASGAISNKHFGYAGDQVILAAFSLADVHCDLLAQGGLTDDETETGRRLGRKLAAIGTTESSPVLLFYDAINRTKGDVRLVAATHLLDGIKQELGFLPDINGAGLQGDYFASPTSQWIGHDIVEHNVLTLSFKGAVQVDSVIMHGCRPATGYYTVTKAEQHTILEINHEPALEFLDRLLGPAIKPEDYPFFLIFGINKGDKWGEFDEKSYINHLSLAIDKERGGLVMFEPDMVAGTEFQIMYRSLNLDYMAPRIEKLFADLCGGEEEREPVFALYIDCAGRAAGYGGVDLDDAVAVQKAVRDRVPLLGIYTGVEIASVEGHPRGLDWTGVFCLFSVPK